MNCYDELFNTIKELIENKNISSYQINKDTGVSYGNINAMRRGERSIENLSLKNAKVLYEYAKGVLDMSLREKDIVMQHIVDLLPIMEETTDSETKDRIDKKITELMEDLNLTWDDMG